MRGVRFFLVVGSVTWRQLTSVLFSLQLPHGCEAASSLTANLSNLLMCGAWHDVFAGANFLRVFFVHLGLAWMAIF